MNSVQTVDVNISIPELPESGSFWLRNFPAHHHLDELYQECVNRPEIAHAQSFLQRVRASRHFWLGDTMLRRRQTLAELAQTIGSAANGKFEIALVLRRDYYRIGPVHLVIGGKGHIYVQAEAPIKDVIAQVLVHEERSCCFDLCDRHYRRLDREKSLADYGLWPAWEDSARQEFPARARLALRARVSWLPRMCYVGAVLLGFAIGYWSISALLAHQLR